MPYSPAKSFTPRLGKFNAMLDVMLFPCFHSYSFHQIINPAYLQSLMQLHCNKSSGFLNPYARSSAPNPILLISGQALCMLHVLSRENVNPQFRIYLATFSKVYQSSNLSL